MEALKTITSYIYLFYKKFRVYALILTMFVIVYFFTGDYTVFDQIKYKNEVSNKLSEIELYKKEIEECDRTIENLERNNEELEKYAREVYYMKKKNEDIFLIEE